MKKISSLFFRARSSWTAIFLLSGLFLVSSCEKPEEDIGLQVQPEEDNLNVVVVDTTTVVAFAVMEDSIRTDELSLSLLGSYQDPEFGVVGTEMYTHIRLSAVDPLTGLNVNDLVMDSVVLSLVYDEDHYGNLDEQSFSVYRVTEDFVVDSPYYSNQHVAFDADNLAKPGFNVITPNKTDYVPVGNDSVLPHLRLRLKESFGEEIFFNEAGTGSYASSEAFVEFFKGLHLTATPTSLLPGSGGVLYLDLMHTESKMTVYYRDTANQDTLSFDFTINSSSARFNHFTHTYTGTNIANQFSDTTQGNQSVYVQAAAGVKTKIWFPYIKNYVDSGNIAINKAELVFPIASGSTTTYLPPERLFILGVDSAGQEVFIADQFEGDLHVDGYLSADGTEYRIKVTRHITELLTGQTEDNGLYIVAGLSGVSANRVVINGLQSMATEKLRLELTYSKY